MRAVLGAALVLALAGPGQAREPLRPAELPPADYAGQQYVDSKGCMFVRAGSGGEVVWVPRVSREGAPICSNPPSGGRVPVAEEIGTKPFALGDAAPAVNPAVDPAPAEKGSETSAAGGYYVAVGSFGVTANSDRAEAKLVALGYPVLRGRVQGGSSTLITVFAGPFADSSAAAAAELDLRGKGFPDAVVIRR